VHGWRDTPERRRNEKKTARMLGQRSAQRGLFEADTLLVEFVGKADFYGSVACSRDEDFAGQYCRNNGRPNAQATALVLQAYAAVSDDEANQSADYYLRWMCRAGH
jgi:hypothetical protein